MNDKLRDFAKQELKNGLSQCTTAEVLLFKRMYSHKNLNANIGDVVDNMPDDKLSWAMDQVDRTLKKK